jgi:hypothetical protein
MNSWCENCGNTMILSDLVSCNCGRGGHSSSELHCSACAIAKNECQICGKPLSDDNIDKPFTIDDAVTYLKHMGVLHAATTFSMRGMKYNIIGCNIRWFNVKMEDENGAHTIVFYRELCEQKVKTGMGDRLYNEGDGMKPNENIVAPDFYPLNEGGPNGPSDAEMKISTKENK